ncbi:MAG TPA: ATP-binding protein [Gemmatimonadales bacterium]|nr:ATP-binding protein [Gemmatimonadales bacterium]
MTPLLATLAGLAALAAAAAAGRSLAARRSRVVLAHTKKELSRRLNEVFALQELSFVLSESLQPARIAEQVAGYLTRFSDGQGSLVALTVEGTQAVRIAAAAGSLAGLKGREIPESDGGLLMAALGREQLVLGGPEDGERPVLADGVMVSRAAAFPLRAHGVTVGVMAVADPLGGGFEPEALRLLSIVATHASIVISNARFFDLVRAGRDQWETTFNALSEGLAVVDQEGRIRRANRALAAMVGSTGASLAGTPLADTPLGSSMELADRLDAARRGEPAPPLTQRAPSLGRLLRFTAAPMRGDGDARWAVMLVEDVTEQERLETQLIQSEKMAAVGQLVSGVAHELNNPLTSISGLAEFLLEQPAPSERDRDHLRVIREQAERAGRIVRNLLTFARKGPADVTDLDLNDIIQRTVSLVGYELRLREVRLETSLDPGLPGLTGDRYQIQQVVLNLVTNAIHAVQDNPPDRARRIGVATTAADGQVILRVSDTGPGIPEQVVPQIFTPFFTTKAPGQGTGLGLSISYRIVEGHGGTIAVQRGLDGGAVFVVRLPIRAATGAARRASGTATAPVEEAGTPAESPRYEILVVDEDPAIRRMLSVLLGSPTQVVETASEAAVAIALLEEREFDLVIADARAPVSAGERFPDHLFRRWPDLRERSILLTADVRPETEAWLAGLAVPYFIKPFKVGELKAATARILRARRLVGQ